MCHTPMETKVVAHQDEFRGMEYQSVVGALRYLIHTRPDLAHLVSYVSQFMEEPHEDHQTPVKQILRYITGTRDHGVRYARGGVGELLLLGYNDCDHGGDVKDTKSTSGIMFYLGRSPITWQSPKKKLVALSSRKAEYVALSAVAYHAIWLVDLLSEILGACINQAASFEGRQQIND
jgi:hypothetical protein